MTHGQPLARLISRRWFLRDCGVGLGSIALADLLRQHGHADERAADPLAAKLPHIAPKAKRVVYLVHGRGAEPSGTVRQQAGAGQIRRPIAAAEIDRRLSGRVHHAQLQVPRAEIQVRQVRPSAAPNLSELLPHLATVVDDIAIVKSMATDAFNHAPAQIMMNTGAQQFGRPELRGLDALRPGQRNARSARVRRPAIGQERAKRRQLVLGQRLLADGLPGRAVPQRRRSGALSFQSRAASMPTCSAIRSTPSRTSTSMRLDAVGDPEIATRINSFEMAYRMQASAPELMDVSKEPKAVLDMYGAEPGKPSFANNCLLARRLLERGVRFVQLFHEVWDQHGNLVKDLTQNCLDTDRPCAALVKDLKRRGMLDDTLVIWGGEFGRTPMVQGGNDGRDHHPNCFYDVVRRRRHQAGHHLGASDEFGFNVVEDRVHVHDLHATLLHLLGFDHTKLTFKFQGRQFRLTDVHGNLVTKLLA